MVVFGWGRLHVELRRVGSGVAHPRSLPGFGGAAFARRTARYVEPCAGVALWLPPGTEFDHAAIEASLPPGRQTEFAPVFEKLACHHPKEKHWYIPLIAVDPAHQEGGVALRSWRTRFADATVITLPPIWNQPIRRTSRFTRGTDSNSKPRSRWDHRSRSFRCCVQPADRTSARSISREWSNSNIRIPLQRSPLRIRRPRANTRTAVAPAVSFRATARSSRTVLAPRRI